MPSLQDYQIPEMQVVKQKFPQYKDTNDITLLNSIVRKFPVYKPIADRVGPELIQKLKEGHTADEEKTPALSSALRSIMGTSVIEQMNTLSARLTAYDNLPKGKDELETDYEKRIDTHMAKRENDIAKQGSMAQLDTPLTMFVGGGIIKAPVLTMKILAGFGALEAGANATGANKAISSIKDPNIRDSVDLAKNALFGVLSGGLASGKVTQTFTTDRIHPSILSAALDHISSIPDLPPEQVLGAKKALVQTVAKVNNTPVEEVIKSVQPQAQTVSSKVEVSKDSKIKASDIAARMKEKKIGYATAKQELVSEAKSPIAEPTTGVIKTTPTNQPTQPPTPTAGNTPNVGSLETVASEVIKAPKDKRLDLIKQRAQAPYRVTLETPNGEQVIVMPLNKLMDLKDNIKEGNSLLNIIDAVRVEDKPSPQVSVTPDAKVEVKQAPVSKEEPSYPNPKVSGISRSVEANAITNKLTTGFGDLSTFSSINLKDAVKSDIMLYDRDPKLAKEIAMGRVPSQPGSNSFVMYEIVENLAMADGDVNTLRELATESKLNKVGSEAGQTLRILRERDPGSPVTAMSDVKETRVKSVETKLKSEGKSIESERTKIINELRRAKDISKIGRTSLQSFIEGVIC